VLGAFGPRAILLAHRGDFFRPMERGARPLAAIAVPRLADALAAAEPGVRLGTVPLGETLVL